MNRTRMLLLAACLGFSLQGMSQQVLEKDAAGDREYARVIREYEHKRINKARKAMVSDLKF